MATTSTIYSHTSAYASLAGSQYFQSPSFQAQCIQEPYQIQTFQTPSFQAMPNQASVIQAPSFQTSFQAMLNQIPSS